MHITLTITAISAGRAGGLVNAYMDFVTHKPAAGKAATKDESKFMVVSFAPAAMNAILTAIQAVR